MARIVTRATLRTRVQQRADVENDEHVSITELNDLVNEAVTQVWDILVASAPPDYYSKEVSLTCVAGTIQYDLATLASDFYKLRRIWQDVGNTHRRDVNIARDDMREFLEAPTGGEQLIVRYIPNAPLFTADNGAGGTFDGINGWEELIVLEAAIQVLMKQERDPSGLMARRAHEEARIRSMAPRDAGSPQTIRAVRTANRFVRRDPWLDCSNTIAGYQLVGSNLEIYRARVGWF